MGNEGANDGADNVEEKESVRVEEEAPTETIEEELQAEQIAAEVPLEPIERMKTRAGLTLCYIAMGLVGLVSLMMLIYFFATTQGIKSLQQPLTQESLAVYREARSMIVEDVIKLSDRFLGNILLPVLTLILGYIFGSREYKAEEGD